MSDFTLKKFDLQSLIPNAHAYERRGSTIIPFVPRASDPQAMKKGTPVTYPSINHAKRVSRRLQQEFGKTVRRI